MLLSFSFYEGKKSFRRRRDEKSWVMRLLATIEEWVSESIDFRDHELTCPHAHQRTALQLIRRYNYAGPPMLPITVIISEGNGDQTEMWRKRKRKKRSNNNTRKKKRKTPNITGPPPVIAYHDTQTRTHTQLIIVTGVCSTFRVHKS